MQVLADTLADVELGLPERWGEFVLDHLAACSVTQNAIGPLNGADSADVDALRCIELERVPTGGGLRAAEHNANLHASDLPNMLPSLLSI